MYVCMSVTLRNANNCTRRTLNAARAAAALLFTSATCDDNADSMDGTMDDSSINMDNSSMDEDDGMS